MLKLRQAYDNIKTQINISNYKYQGKSANKNPKRKNKTKKEREVIAYRKTIKSKTRLCIQKNIWICRK